MTDLPEHEHRCPKCSDLSNFPPIPDIDTPLTQYVGISNELREISSRHTFHWARITVNGIQTWGEDRMSFGIVEAFRGETDGWVIASHPRADGRFCPNCGEWCCYFVIRGKVEIAL